MKLFGNQKKDVAFHMSLAAVDLAVGPKNRFAIIVFKRNAPESSFVAGNSDTENAVAAMKAFIEAGKH